MGSLRGVGKAGVARVTGIWEELRDETDEAGEVRIEGFSPRVFLFWTSELAACWDAVVTDD